MLRHFTNVTFLSSQGFIKISTTIAFLQTKTPRLSLLIPRSHSQEETQVGSRPKLVTKTSSLHLSRYLGEHQTSFPESRLQCPGRSTQIQGHSYRRVVCLRSFPSPLMWAFWSFYRGKNQDQRWARALHSTIQPLYFLSPSALFMPHGYGSRGLAHDPSLHSTPAIGCTPLLPHPASYSKAKTAQLWFRLNESLRIKQRRGGLSLGWTKWAYPPFVLLFVLKWQYAMTQYSHSKKTTLYFLFLKMKWNKWAENGSCWEGKKSSEHINAAWRLNECAGMWGDRIPWWGGADDKATQQSPSQLLSGKTWRSKHRSPSLLDLASTFTGTGGREERTFAKLLQGRGMEKPVCLIPESLPSQTAWLEANERMGKKGTASLGADSQHCVPLGRNEPRGSNLLHPALLKWGNWPRSQ